MEAGRSLQNPADFLGDPESVGEPYRQADATGDHVQVRLAGNPGDCHLGAEQQVEPVPTTILSGRCARGLPTGFQFIPCPGRTLNRGSSPRRSTSLTSSVVTSGLGTVIVDITAPFSIRLLSDSWSVPWRPRP